MTRKVIIVGVSGSFGWQMASTFLSKGWPVIGLSRQLEGVDQPPQGLQMMSYQEASAEGDIYSAILNIAEPGDVLVYALNPPYPQWEQWCLKLLEPVVQAATDKQLTLLFPGNVYAYNPSTQQVFNEDAKLDPPTAKGVIRQQMEACLQKACEKGLKVILLRAGNFIDIKRTSKTSWFNLLVKSHAKGITILNPSQDVVTQCWAYLPDFAATFEKLVRIEHQLEGFNSYHFKGHEFTFQALHETLVTLSDKPVKLKHFQWFPLKILALVSPLIREVLSMRYLWDTPLLLDDTKLKAELEHEGGPVHTPIDKVLADLNVV